MGKVIKLPENPFYEFLDDLRRAYDEDRLVNFVCIGDAKYPESEEESKTDFFASENILYWFGESSTTCLGLCEVMQDAIKDYVRYVHEMAKELREEGGE